MGNRTNVMNNYVNQLNQLLKQKGPQFKFFYVTYDTIDDISKQWYNIKTDMSFALIMDMTIYHQTETFEEMKNYIITKQKFN